MMIARRLASGCSVLLGLAGFTLAPTMAGELVEGEAQADGTRAVGDGYRFRVARCGSVMRSEWRSAQGELLAWDEVQLIDGRLLRYRLVRPNIGQDITRDGAQGGTDDGLPILAGPMLIEHARRALPALRAGEVMRVRYLIAETGMLLPLRLRATLEFDAAARFVGMHGQILPQRGSGQRPEPIAARVRVLASGPTSGCHDSTLLLRAAGA